MLTTHETRAIVAEQSVPEPNTGCLLWLGPTDSYGYAQLRTKRRRIRISRALLGLTDRRLNACHHCDTPLCVNEGHLFAGTQRDNLDDMAAKGRANNGGWRTGRTEPSSNGYAEKTHCKHGHEFTPRNTQVAHDGHRSCRTCKRDWDRRNPH